MEKVTLSDHKMEGCSEERHSLHVGSDLLVTTGEISDCSDFVQVKPRKRRKGKSQRLFGHMSTCYSSTLIICVLYLSTIILSVSASILGSLDYESKNHFHYLNHTSPYNIYDRMK